MVSVSLCMIVRNEEDVLARCLESIANLVDEIIIVDTGSVDKTKEIAAAYTSKVYTFPWIDDFAAARNYSFSKASMDYCMWMDADDVLSKSEQDAFLHLKKSLASVTDIVMMKYNTSFDSEGNPVFSYFRERWIKNDGRHHWMGEVHEVIPLIGNLIYSDIAISHKKLGGSDPDRNLRIYRKLLAEQKILDPRQQYYYGRELYYHGLYEETVSVLKNFLELKEGWMENKIEACSICAECYYKLNKEEAAINILLKSLSFDLPRAEICCSIGKHFLERGNYNLAVYWYEMASKIDRNDKTGGFILPDCYDYVPYLQLCVCYDRIGDRKKAEEYNEKAGVCKPDSKAYLYNKNYFNNEVL